MATSCRRQWYEMNNIRSWRKSEAKQMQEQQQQQYHSKKNCKTSISQQMWTDYVCVFAIDSLFSSRCFAADVKKKIKSIGSVIFL